MGRNVICDCCNKTKHDDEFEAVICNKCADEIERLRAENKEHIEAYQKVAAERERLRAALEQIAGSSYCTPLSKFAGYMKRIAREALKDD